MLELKDLITILQEAICQIDDTVKDHQFKFIAQFFEFDSSTSKSILENSKELLFKFIYIFKRNPPKEDITTVYAFYECILDLEKGVKNESDINSITIQIFNLINILRREAENDIKLIHYNLNDINEFEVILKDFVNALEKNPEEKSTKDEVKNLLNVKNIESLSPKMVNLQYPQKTSQGYKILNIKVPLITLVPLESTKIDHLKLRLNLEVLSEGKELKVSFAPSSANKLSPENKENQNGLGYLEVTMSSGKVPSGLLTIADAYGKILKTQIPI